jgi:glutaredoxin-like protein NrdH
MFCNKVKEFLSQNKIEFIERDVASHETALEELQKLGYMTTPVTLVGEDLVVGFDFNKLQKLLEKE